MLHSMYTRAHASHMCIMRIRMSVRMWINANCAWHPTYNEGLFFGDDGGGVGRIERFICERNGRHHAWNRKIWFHNHQINISMKHIAPFMIFVVSACVPACLFVCDVWALDVAEWSRNVCIMCLMITASDKTTTNNVTHSAVSVATSVTIHFCYLYSRNDDDFILHFFMKKLFSDIRQKKTSY